MGGAGGHISHPFELDCVNTGADLLNFFSDLAQNVFSGKIPAYLKFDGANYSVKVVTKNGKRQFAIDRGTNKALDVSGVTLGDVDSRFETEDSAIGPKILLQILNSAFPYVQKHLRALGLLNDPTKFLNLDYVANQTNAIDYQKQFIAIHGVNQFYEKEPKIASVESLPRPGLVRESGNDQISRQLSYDASVLNDFIAELTPYAERFGFTVVGPTPVRPMSQMIDSYFPSLNRKVTIKIGQFEFKIASLAEWLQDLVIPKDIKVKTSDGKLKSALAKSFYRDILAPKNGNSPTHVMELAENPDDGLALINGALTWHATRLLGRDLLARLESDFGPCNDQEGIVVALKNEKPVKVTGDFIVNGEDFSKFATDRSEIPLLRENFPDMATREDHSESKTFHVVFIPGGFKPPTVAHIDTIRQYADVADMVFIVSSERPRKIRDGWEVTHEQSRKILELYAGILPNNPFSDNKIHYVTVSDKENPIGVIIDMIAGHKLVNIDGIESPVSFNNEDEEKTWNRQKKFAKFFHDLEGLAGEKCIEVSVGSSSKGRDMERTFNLVEYFHKNPQLLPPKVKVTHPPIIPTPFRVDGIVVCATDMRSALKDCDREKVKKFLPIRSDELLDKVLDILEFGKHCGNTVVIESSGAAAGGVAGFASPFMSVNKEKKGKMKKASLTTLEEERLKRIIRHLIKEAGEKSGNLYDSTALNYLNEIWKQVKDKITNGYKQLASSSDQRKSYFVHMLFALDKMFDTYERNLKGGESEEQAQPAPEPVVESLKYKVDGDFLLVSEEHVRKLLEAIETDEAPQVLSSDEGIFSEREAQEQDAPSEEEKEYSNFVIAGLDEIGSRAAYRTFDEIKSPVENKLTELPGAQNAAERKKFEDFLIANVSDALTNTETEMNLPDPRYTQYLERLNQEIVGAVKSGASISDLARKQGLSEDGTEPPVVTPESEGLDIKSIIAGVDPEVAKAASAQEQPGGLNVEPPVAKPKARRPAKV